MSQENVEQRFLRIIDAYNRGDVEAMVALLHPEVEWYPLSAQVEGDESYSGHEGIRRWWAISESVWREVHASVEEVRVLDEMILALGTFQGRFQSGVELEMDTAWLCRYREGLITWGRIYTSREEALAAVGLSE